MGNWNAPRCNSVQLGATAAYCSSYWRACTFAPFSIFLIRMCVKRSLVSRNPVALGRLTLERHRTLTGKYYSPICSRMRVQFGCLRVRLYKGFLKMIQWYTVHGTHSTIKLFDRSIILLNIINGLRFHKFVRFSDRCSRGKFNY